MRVLCEGGQTKTVRVCPGLGARSKVCGGMKVTGQEYQGALPPLSLSVRSREEGGQGLLCQHCPSHNLT